MASVFTHIIKGDLPGHFVYQDELAVAIMTIQPIRAGHVLVIPKAEVDEWYDLPEETITHLMKVSKKISTALKQCFDSTRVGLLIAGLEVPHTHLHLIPMDSMSDLDITNAKEVPTQELIDHAKLISKAIEKLA